jgi:hypothetical protein
VLTALVLLAAAPQARAAPVLDQQFNPNPITINAGFAGSEPSQQRAQTFTAGITGTLDHVDVLVERLGLAAGFLDVSVVPTVAGGSPDPSVFSPQVMIPAADVSSSPGFVTADLSGLGIQVTAGQQYAIVLSASPGASFFGWLGAVGTGAVPPYTGGAEYERDLPNHNWGIFPGDSLGFREFVNAGEVPEPASVTLSAVGLLGLVGYGCRRRS